MVGGGGGGGDELCDARCQNVCVCGGGGGVETKPMLMKASPHTHNVLLSCEYLFI